MGSPTMSADVVRMYSATLLLHRTSRRRTVVTCFLNCYLLVVCVMFALQASRLLAFRILFPPRQVVKKYKAWPAPIFSSRFVGARHRWRRGGEGMPWGGTRRRVRPRHAHNVAALPVK